MSVDGPWFYSFALRNRLVVTQSEAQMQELLTTGKPPRRPASGEALFVLEGEKRLVQAGADAQRLAKLERGANWDSKILKNTKKVGLLLTDADGKLALDLRLHAEEREKAVSLRNIVLGLVGLSMFNDELDPSVAALLRSVDVSLDGSALRLRVAARPELFLNAVK